MIISAGIYARRRLQYPTDRSFRPTKSIVRESVFNIIGPAIANARFLDLCSGTGAMGLEAESRGAQAICVDQYTDYIERNKASLKAAITIIKSDVCRYLKKAGESVDFIYLDPVWSDHATYHTCLKAIRDGNRLTPHGRLFVEHHHTLVLSPTYSVIKQYTYGDSLVSEIAL